MCHNSLVNARMSTRLLSTLFLQCTVTEWTCGNRVDVMILCPSQIISEDKNCGVRPTPQCSPILMRAGELGHSLNDQSNVRELR
jgi:hypothetical protein